MLRSGVPSKLFPGHMWLPAFLVFWRGEPSTEFSSSHH